jgi:hypothetical protein
MPAAAGSACRAVWHMCSCLICLHNIWPGVAHGLWLGIRGWVSTADPQVSMFAVLQVLRRHRPLLLPSPSTRP